MEWLCNLILGSGVAHSILVVAIVIALGVILGKFKIFGIGNDLDSVCRNHRFTFWNFN